MSVNTTVSHRVYFEGSWGANDQEQISNAVADFEAEQHDTDLFPTRPSWVCVAYDVGTSALFCAHRPHLSNVLSAKTVEDLAQSIRNATT